MEKNKYNQFYQVTLDAQLGLANTLLVKHYGNMTKVAKELGINRGSLRRLVVHKKPIGLREGGVDIWKA